MGSITIYCWSNLESATISLYNKEVEKVAFSGRWDELNALAIGLQRRKLNSATFMSLRWRKHMISIIIKGKLKGIEMIYFGVFLYIALSICSAFIFSHFVADGK